MPRTGTVTTNPRRNQRRDAGIDLWAHFSSQDSPKRGETPGALCCGFSQMKTLFSSGGIYSVLTVADKNERPKRLTDRREEGSHRSVPIGFLAEKDLRVAAIFLSLCDCTLARWRSFRTRSGNRSASSESYSSTHLQHCI
jgi:hypothetical protein